MAVNPYDFIIGCPRSGTTLLQRIVGAQPASAVVFVLDLPYDDAMLRFYEGREKLDFDSWALPRATPANPVRQKPPHR